MDVSDLNRNKAIYNAIEKILSRLDEGMPVAVIGDFNCHVGFLGEQSKNRKGEMMLEFMERWNMVILNMDDRCEGVYTRIQGREKSVIDYYLVNEEMFSLFKKMEIDEEKGIFDLSDHCYFKVDSTV